MGHTTSGREDQGCEGGMLNFSDALFVCTFLHGFMLSVAGRHLGLSVGGGMWVVSDRGKTTFVYGYGCESVEATYVCGRAK